MNDFWEDTITPHFSAKHKERNALFVRCDWYTPTLSGLLPQEGVLVRLTQTFWLKTVWSQTPYCRTLEMLNQFSLLIIL